MTRRRALALLGVTPLALAGCGGSDETLVGTELDGDPAPDFSLLDYRGEVVQLSSLEGRAVVLSFIFTNCPDICPTIAVGLRSTYDLLAEDRRDKVAFVAVSVDPGRDTPDALRDFSQRYRLDEAPQWHALGGTREELEPVWVAYGIDPGEVTEEVESHTSGGGRPYLLSHTDAVYLIDRDGKKRVFLRSNFLPKDLARNLEILT